MKEFLTAKGVPFTVKDVGSDERALEELSQMGIAAVPVILVDGQTIVGFDRTKLQKALGLS